MSTPAMVPVFAPDGSIGDVPASNVGAAVAAGGKIGVNMQDHQGAWGVVPFDKYPEAMKAREAMRVQSEQEQSKGAASRFLQGAGGAAVGIGKGLVNVFTADPHGTAETVADAAGLLPAYRSTIEPQVDQAKQAIQGSQSPDLATRIASGGHAIAALIPGLGPALAGTSDAISPNLEKGDLAGAAGKVLTTAAAAALTHKAAGLIGDAVDARLPVQGQNYNEGHASAFEGLISKPGVTGDKNFIPQQVTPEALSPIRQTVADMAAKGTAAEKAIADAVTGAKTKALDRLGAFNDILKKLDIPYACAFIDGQAYCYKRGAY